MGLGPDEVQLEAWDSVGKSKEKGRRKKKKDEAREETGCWIKFRLMGSCISSRSKVDSSISSASTHCGNSRTNAMLLDLNNHYFIHIIRCLFDLF